MRIPLIMEILYLIVKRHNINTDVTNVTISTVEWKKVSRRAGEERRIPARE